MDSPMYTNVWFIPGWLFFAIVVIVAITLFATKVRRRIMVLMLGAPENRIDQPVRRFGALIARVFGQTKILRESYTGILHVLIFYGFVVLIIGNCFLFAEAFWPSIGEQLERCVLYGMIVALVEVFIIFVYIGVIMAAYRRFIIKPDRLDWSPDANFILLLIFSKRCHHHCKSTF